MERQRKTYGSSKFTVSRTNKINKKNFERNKNVYIHHTQRAGAFSLQIYEIEKAALPA